MCKVRVGSTALAGKPFRKKTFYDIVLGKQFLNVKIMKTMIKGESVGRKRATGRAELFSF